MNNDQIRQPKPSVSEQSLNRRTTFQNAKISAIKLLKQLTEAEKTKKIQLLQEKIVALGEINKFIELALKKNESDLVMFTEDRLIIYIRYYFIENIPKIQPLKYLRLILLHDNVVDRYLLHNIPIYIARVIERDEPKASQEQEISQALRLINDWICKFPKKLPKYLISTLIAYGELPTQSNIAFEQKRKEYTISLVNKKLAVEAIMNLAINNTMLCCNTGGFTVLSNALLDSNLMEQASDLICNLLYFINQKKNRDIVLRYIDLSKPFHVFTDLDFVLLEETNKFKGIEGLNKLQNQLDIAKTIILTMLKSWTGLIYIGNQPSTIKAFLEALKQIPKAQQSQVRKVIFEILDEILTIGENFVENNLEENKFRAVNLINCYLMTMIQLLIQNNLFKILIELSSVEEGIVTQSAQKLLKKLTVLIFNLFPQSSTYVDFLLTAAITTDSNVLKSSSSYMLTKIGNYIYDKKKQNPHQLLGRIENLFNLNHLYLSPTKSSVISIMQTINFMNHRNVPDYRKKLLDMNMIDRQHKLDHHKWKWALIEQFLSFPDPEKITHKSDTNSKFKQSKLYKYLLRFYSPSQSAISSKFTQQKWIVDTFEYVKVGQLLIKNAITISEYIPLIRNPRQSQFECTISLVGQLEKLLQKILMEITNNPKQLYTPFYKFYERELMLWIGMFSHSKIGYHNLLCENNFFEILYSYIDRPQCACVISAIMFHFDYYCQNMEKKLKDDIRKRFNIKTQRIIVGPKALLERIIQFGSQYLILDCIQMLRMLFKSELGCFQKEGLELLLKLLVKDDITILKMSLQLLEDLLQKKEIGIHFLNILSNPKNSKGLEAIRKSLSMKVICRLICLEGGIDFVNKNVPGWLETQYHNWMQLNESFSYCLKLQSLLDKSLNFTAKQLVGYRISSEKSYIELLYIYKLPWLCYLNNKEYALHVRYNNNKFILYCPIEQTVNYNRVEVGIGIGSMYIDINLNESYIKSAHIITLDGQEMEEQTMFKSSSAGITLYYRVVNAESTNPSYELIEIEIEIKIYKDQENQQLPLHLIQQLTETKQGIKFLQSKNFLQYSSVRLKESSSALEIRSILWGIGYFGSTEEGIASILSTGLLAQIINISLTCQTLSLRGTSRYVLNMFCLTQKGRQFIQSHNYNVNKRCLTCFPKQSSIFFQFENTKNNHYSMEDQYWKNYRLKPMNPNEQRLFNCIKQLINSHLSLKSATIEFRQIIKNNNRVLHSVNLFNNVIQLLSFYKLRFQSRKIILNMFEEWIKLPQFSVETQNKIQYYC